MKASLFFSYSGDIYCFTIVLPAIVIPPVLANALPSRVAPVLKVIDCIAITVPLKYLLPTLPMEKKRTLNYKPLVEVTITLNFIMQHYVYVGIF
jgi:hypothetical protein